MLCQKHFGAIHQVMTFPAVPFKAVFRAFGTRNFDDQANRAGSEALRRMTRVFRKQKDLAFLDGNFDGRFAGLFHHANENIAFQLVEKFLGGIVVIIQARIRAAYDGDDNVAVFPHLSIADGRLQLFAIGVNPALKIEGFQVLMDGIIFSFRLRRAACRRSPSSR